MATTYTFDSLVKEVIERGSLQVNINGIDIGGQYDRVSHYLVWTSGYAIRNDQYIKDIIDGKML